MSCDQFSAGWKACVIGVADAATTAAMTEHARFCPGCGKRWRELEDLRGTLQIVLDRQLLPATLRESVSRQVRLPEWPVAASAVSHQVAQVSVTHRTIVLLSATRPWVMFLSIAGFLISALVILGGLLLGMLDLLRGSAFLIVRAGLYVLVGIIYGIAAIHGYRYASRIADLRSERTTQALESALDAQRVIWKYVGVVTIILMALYLVGIFLGFVGGVLGLRL